MRNTFQKHKRGVLKALSKFAVESIEYGLTLERYMLYNQINNLMKLIIVNTQ